MKLPRRTFLGFMASLALVGCRRRPRTAGPSASPSPGADLAAAVSGGTREPGVTWSGNGTLREYYLHGKYPQEEIDAVSKMLLEVFPDRKASQRSQMTAEILSFHYVIYHPTDSHDLRHNHRLIRKHEPMIRKLCERHGVAPLPVLAITSWENSGGTDKESWADARGLGQMTWGAVGDAHRHATLKAKELKEQAQWEHYHGTVTKDKARVEKAKLLRQKASVLNVKERHQKMAKKAGVKDERSIAECNLEDVVLFFDFLDSHFAHRPDHTIGAYHRGALNHDDILYDYLRRRDPTILYPQPGDRSSFLEGLKRFDVSYLDLWNDPRSREMLNGLRTVEGEVTTKANAKYALGDETDIYPWKVLGSLSGFLAGADYVDRAAERYALPQLAGEVRGLPAYLGEEGRRSGANKGFLVQVPSEIWDLGTPKHRQHWVRPELAGYLMHLSERMARVVGRGAWPLPFIALGEAVEGKSGWETELHAKGVAAKFSITGLSVEQKRLFEHELQQDYLFDRIYLRSTKQAHHLVVNPRFGHEFMKLYDAKMGVRRSGNGH